MQQTTIQQEGVHIKPRIRTIKPEMWQSRDFRSVPLVAQLLFVCLINHADDEGRLKTDAEHISDTMLKILAPEIQKGIDALVARKMIAQYSIGGEPFIALTHWANHQKVDHARASDYPPPPPKKVRERSRGLATARVSRAPADPDPYPYPDPDLTPTPITDAVRLCELFVVLLSENGVKVPHPIPDAWLDDMDRLLRLDSRQPEQVEQVLRWSQQDAFWKTNIHSPGKLRMQFDKLRLKMQAPVPGQNRALTAGRDWKDLANQLKAAGQ